MSSQQPSQPVNPYITRIHKDHEIQTALRSGDWEPHVRNRYLALLQLSRGEEINVPKVNAGRYHAITTQRPKAPVRTLNTPAEQLGVAEIPADVRAAQRAIGLQRMQQFPEIEAMPGGRVPGGVSAGEMASGADEIAWGIGEDDPVGLDNVNLMAPPPAPAAAPQPDVFAPAMPVDPEVAAVLSPSFVPSAPLAPSAPMEPSVLPGLDSVVVEAAKGGVAAAEASLHTGDTGETIDPVNDRSGRVIQIGKAPKGRR